MPHWTSYSSIRPPLGSLDRLPPLCVWMGRRRLERIATTEAAGARRSLALIGGVVTECSDPVFRYRRRFALCWGGWMVVAIPAAGVLVAGQSPRGFVKSVIRRWAWGRGWPLGVRPRASQWRGRESHRLCTTSGLWRWRALFECFLSLRKSVRSADCSRHCRYERACAKLGGQARFWEERMRARSSTLIMWGGVSWVGL